MNVRATILFLLFFSLYLCKAQKIIPYPNQYEPTKGELKVPKTISITASGEFASLIPGFIQSAEQFSVSVIEKRSKGFIQLVQNSTLVNPEEYRLTITSREIMIEAGEAAGCFYGLQSALQLIINAGSDGKIPCAFIHDWPRYAWRSLMLDEARHFIGMEQVKSLLDFMALQKLNKFHWHLTDSHGWRIEIKQYPLLTSIGARGDLTNPNGAVQYYTQAEIAEIVGYARQRFIEIIPEIDMPGHATAATRAYPEFSGGGSKRYPNYTFNPGKEGTYTFITNILKEVTTLFPSRYIHIGGDEVHFGNEEWNSIVDVQQLMKKHDFSNLIDVEHYFIKRMSDSIRNLNKTLIGWDEVVDANLPVANTVVMWWRHEKPKQLDKAISKGYQVIMCPRIPLYFDFIQLESHKYGRKWSDGAYVPIELVYNFPGTDYTSGVSISTDLIKGMQANLWTERIHSPERLQFMAYPRMSALSEAAWTQDKMKNFENFNSRMDYMMKIYEKKGVTYFNYRNVDAETEVPGPVR
ncbi:MAG: beta-N-acetylhexosaminidase [Paludibacter sp.]|nr:beta-N-acetylhexosaminidase [Paludibacter sp.]MDD4198978.1 beta-N-acetylhexosaminidase [Paludibacter sp.]MDD4427821.1 beta-N-acetylhexosaminidase [Paludibacter sp.]